MATIKIRRGTSENAAERNPILGDGELGYEIDTQIFRIGNGLDRFTDLPEYIDRDEVISLISDAVENSTGGPSNAELIAYLADDGIPEGFVGGQSFELIYQNRKV